MSMNTFDTRRKPMRKFVILAGVVILVVVGCLIMTLQGNTKDHIKVGIRSDATGVYDSDGMNITWVVENESANEVRFDKGKIAQIAILFGSLQDGRAFGGTKLEFFIHSATVDGDIWPWILLALLIAEVICIVRTVCMVVREKK